MVNSVNGSRRVVRRRARPAADVAYEKALPDLAPEVRIALQLWVDARRAERAARDRMEDIMIKSTGAIRWREVEAIARSLG